MYQMAAYCRLSKEDKEEKNSESIENQLRIIKKYIENQKEMELAQVYIDDGYSGMYFAQRPAFQRMMKDIYQKKVQGVIVKDISRLGREHIETSNYLEKIFPSLQIRFIAVLDAIDSISHQNEELAQLKTLFNDMYCRDISKKIRSSLEIRKKQGDYMSGFAPYGYQKNPENKHQFLIDEEAAKVVQNIFFWYLAGYSKLQIADKLNQQGILIPSEYKRQVLKLPYHNAREIQGLKKWSYSTIHAILKNRVYIGDMVQHKSEKISYKIEKCRCIPLEEQIIVEHTHEAIIDKEIFWQVQQKLKK